MKVLGGAYTARYTTTLHDLARLALVTGARLDELCALRTSDVHKREDGWWITIREGKTEAAVTRCPHSRQCRPCARAAVQASTQLSL